MGSQLLISPAVSSTPTNAYSGHYVSQRRESPAPQRRDAGFVAAMRLIWFAKSHQLVRRELDDAKIQTLRASEMIRLAITYLPPIREILVHLSLGWHLQCLDLVFLSHGDIRSSLTIAKRRTRRGRALPHLLSHRHR